MLTLANGISMMDDKDAGHVYIIRGSQVVIVLPNILSWTEFRRCLREQNVSWLREKPFIDKLLTDHLEKRPKEVRPHSVSPTDSYRAEMREKHRNQSKRHKHLISKLNFSQLYCSACWKV